MKLKKKIFDILSIVLLVVLVMVEFYIEKDEVFYSAQTLLCLAIGLVIGFNLGYKLSAIHAIKVSEKALMIAEEKGRKLDIEEEAHKKSVNELELALKREKKLTKSLEINLQDRDSEVKELVSACK
jgi:predicted membrane protein